MALFNKSLHGDGGAAAERSTCFDEDTAYAGDQ